MIEVMLVDDHPLIRLALRTILSGRSDVSVVAEASSGEEALEKARRLRPQVVIIDVDMPGMGGVECTRRLAALTPRPGVLVISMYEQPPFPQLLLDAGALGYLPKGGQPEEVLEAVAMVAKGELYINAKIATDLIKRGYHSHVQSPFDCLSPREKQIMMMLIHGQTTQTIAKVLNVSAKTVCTHRYRIFDKLGVKSDVELTLFAMHHGLLKDE